MIKVGAILEKYFRKSMTSGSVRIEKIADLRQETSTPQKGW
jgi:hypothetical protein